MKGKFGNLVFAISLLITASSLIGCGKGPALMLPSDFGAATQDAAAPSAPSTATAVGEVTDDAATDGLGSTIDFVPIPPAQAVTVGTTVAPANNSSLYLKPTLENYSVPANRNGFLILVFSDPSNKLQTDKLDTTFKIRKKQMVNGTAEYSSNPAISFVSCDTAPDNDNLRRCAISELQNVNGNIIPQWSPAPYSYEIVLKDNSDTYYNVADSIFDEVFSANGIDFNFPNFPSYTVYPSHPQASIAGGPVYTINN